MEWLIEILELLFCSWRRMDDGDERRSCFWVIVIFIVLLLIIGSVLWLIFR